MPWKSFGRSTTGFSPPTHSTSGTTEVGTLRLGQGPLLPGLLRGLGSFDSDGTNVDRDPPPCVNPDIRLVETRR